MVSGSGCSGLSWAVARGACEAFCIGVGGWEDWGIERGGSGGDCLGLGDRQVAPGTGQSREAVSAAGNRQACGTVPWASPDQLVGALSQGRG